MSANLISNITGLHDYRDDLESSLYTLLWVTLTYSKCSNPRKVPGFLKSVFDPPPHEGEGACSKGDFLQGRMFLKGVSFPGRDALHFLVDKLAHMFAVRYEEAPTKQDRDSATRINTYSPEDYKTTSAYKYDARMNFLKTHQATIDLFDTVLKDRSQWPLNDRAERQAFHVGPAVQAHERVIKTSWRTTLFVEQRENQGDEVEAQPNRENEVDDYQMVDAETSSGELDSDQVMVGDDATVISGDQGSPDSSLPHSEPTVSPVTAAGFWELYLLYSRFSRQCPQYHHCRRLAFILIHEITTCISPFDIKLFSDMSFAIYHASHPCFLCSAVAWTQSLESKDRLTFGPY